VVGALGVSYRDVTGEPFVEPELSEQSESRGEALLAVAALVLHVVERGEAGRESI
jgi:hypothetical protein